MRFKKVIISVTTTSVQKVRSITALGGYMANEKTNWNDTPSLDDLSVDWSYEVENPLGKRERIRVSLKDLKRVLGIKIVPVRVITKDIDEKGGFLDIEECGAAVLLKNKLTVNQVAKIGFILGEEEIVSLAVVKNMNEVEGKYRTGFLFKDLKPEYETVINVIVTSKNY